MGDLEDRAEAGTGTAAESGRERILEAAYRLFSQRGIRSVGIDAIIAEAGVAKMTLYRNFASKDDLVLAFLQLREERWTQLWLQEEVSRRADTPAGRLLAIFEVFDEWFGRDDFEGCSFINVLLETPDREHPVRQATIQHLANIRRFVRDQAEEAGTSDPDEVACQWHILMKGSIVAAAEGDRDAARRAREVGALLLEHRGAALPAGGAVAA